MTAYATRADLYLYGLPRGLLSNPARMVDSAIASTDTFTLDQHGFEDGDVLLFRAESGGNLPGNIAASTAYYAIRVTDSTFQVSATNGGVAVNLSSDGELVLVAASLEAVIDAELERYSRLVDSYIPAHNVPLESPYPAVIVASVAKLAAASVLELMGQSSTLIQAGAEQTRRELGRLAKGVALRDSRAVSGANLAVATVSSSTARAWDNDQGSGFIP
jgi:hypothetical protein